MFLTGRLGVGEGFHGLFLVCRIATWLDLAGPHTVASLGAGSLSLGVEVRKKHPYVKVYQQYDRNPASCRSWSEFEVMRLRWLSYCGPDKWVPLWKALIT